MTSTTYTNPITAHYLQETNLYGSAGSTSNQGGTGPNTDIESILAEMFGGGDFSGMGSSQASWSNRGRTAVMNRPGFARYPASQLDGQGLKNVKLTEKDGTALNWKEDAAGDLYDGNKEIGQINEDNSVTLNSSAGDEIKKLKDGADDKESHWYNPFSWGNEDKSKTDSSGNVTFGADQVTVNPGDLPPTSQPAQQAGPVIPTPRGPSFYSLQMNIQPVPLAESNQPDIEQA